MNWRTKRVIRNFLSRNPWLYYTVFYLRRRHLKPLVTADTDLVIEGPPRMANSFVRAAIKHVQPKPIKLIGKTHNVMNLIVAAKKKVPAVALIRQPKDSCISNAISQVTGTTKMESLEAALLRYIDFYTPLGAYKDQVLFLQFEAFIGKDLTPFIQQINDRFPIQLANFGPSKPFSQKEIFDIIDREYAEAGYLNEEQVSRPSETRKQLKKEYLALCTDPKIKKLLEEANRLYSNFALK